MSLINSESFSQLWFLCLRVTEVPLHPMSQIPNPGLWLGFCTYLTPDVSFCFAQAKVVPCVWYEVGSKRVWKRPAGIEVKICCPQLMPSDVEEALAPVKVGTGGSSAVFQHWENNHHILTNPSDLCLISKTLLTIKYFQNIYVINFSPKFYGLQRKW